MSPWLPEWNRVHKEIMWVKVQELQVQCPYCGHEWIYTGNDKHYATCPGIHMSKWSDGRPWTWKCDKKVRLHRYLVRTSKRVTGELKFPNKNYERWWEENESK